MKLHRLFIYNLYDIVKIQRNFIAIARNMERAEMFDSPAIRCVVWKTVEHMMFEFTRTKSPGKITGSIEPVGTLKEANKKTCITMANVMVSKTRDKHLKIFFISVIIFNIAV